jgi:hypothetical protein
MLEEAGIIETCDDAITLAADWWERLEAARRVGGELEADELAEQRRRDKSRAYRNREKVEPTPHWTNTGADGHIEDLHPACHLPAESSKCGGDVSPLATAIRSYLDSNPRDACQPPYWIGVTLWAHDLYDGKPTTAECRGAIEELGGERYLRERLAVAGRGRAA